MEQNYIKVADAMQTSLHIVNGLASVREAIDEMRASGVSSLIIERRHEGDEYGIVTMHDIAEKVVGVNRSTHRTSVYEIMSKPALTVPPDMNVRYAIRLLTRFHLSRALVTGHGGLIGIVTLRDLVNRYVDDIDQGDEDGTA